MRAVIVGRFLDHGREAGDRPDQILGFLGGQRVGVDLVGDVVAGTRGLPENPTAACVDVLDVRRGLGLEVERAVPLEGDALGGLFGDDVVPDRADPDLVGDPFDVRLVEVVVTHAVVESILDFFTCAGDRLVEQVVQIDTGSLAGAHPPFGQVDPRIEHLFELVGVVAQEIQRRRELVCLELVVLAQYRHGAVEGVELPLVVGQVPRRIE